MAARIPRILWKEDHATAIGIIDAQHRDLMDLINQATDALEKGAPHPALSPVLELLQDRLCRHFIVEEEFMRVYQFPGFETHLQAHLGFSERIANLIQDFTESPLDLSETIVNLLNGWMDVHILRADKALGAFLSGRGVR